METIFLKRSKPTGATKMRRLRVAKYIMDFAKQTRIDDVRPYKQKPTVKDIIFQLMVKGIDLYKENTESVEFKVMDYGDLKSNLMIHLTDDMIDFLSCTMEEVNFLRDLEITRTEDVMMCFIKEGLNSISK